MINALAIAGRHSKRNLLELVKRMLHIQEQNPVAPTCASWKSGFRADEARATEAVTEQQVKLCRISHGKIAIGCYGFGKYASVTVLFATWSSQHHRVISQRATKAVQRATREIQRASKGIQRSTKAIQKAQDLRSEFELLRETFEVLRVRD